MIKILPFLLVIISLTFSSTNTAYAEVCYAANNFGLGGQLTVHANPDEKLTSGTKLLKTKTGEQVAPWVQTPYFTTGVAKDPECDEYTPPGTTNYACRPNRGILKIYVSGSWHPWGKPTNPSDIKPCTPLLPCNPNFDYGANGSVCFTGDGKKLDKGADDTNTPCELSDGWGLYGLVALDRGGGEPADPNIPPGDVSEKPPSTEFRTFRLAPLESDTEGKYINIDLSKQCDLASTGPNGENFECNSDSDVNDENYVSRGRLYFKIVDSHYSDNTGQYDLNIVSGVFIPEGFIERMVKSFERQIDLVVKNLYQNIVTDSKIISTIRAMLVIYIAIYGLMFMMGLAAASQNDIIVRLIKIGIIVTIISDGSWEFFNTYFFQIFTTGSKQLAANVLEASLYYNGDTDSPRFILPDKASALSIYDILVQMLLSSAIHAKIASLVFYKYFIVYVLFIYVALIFVFVGIIRAIVLYFSALMLVAVLLVAAPIFMVMMLFQITRPIFENWMQQLVGAGMMIIILSAAMALLVLLMLNQIENLFSFKVCEEVIFTVITDEVPFLNWFDFIWFYPSDPAQIERHITFENFIAFLLVAVIFDKIMKDIPQLIDSLSVAQLTPMSQLTGGAMNKLTGAVTTGAEYARAGVTVARKGVTTPLDALASKSSKYRAAKEGISSFAKKVKDSKIATVVGKAGAATKFVLNAPNKLDAAMKSSPRASMSMGQAASNIAGSWKQTGGKLKGATKAFEKAEAVKDAKNRR